MITAAEHEFKDYTYST